MSIRVVLGSETTQTVFDSKNEELKKAFANHTGDINSLVELDMSETGVTSKFYVLWLHGACHDKFCWYER